MSQPGRCDGNPSDGCLEENYGPGGKVRRPTLRGKRSYKPGANRRAARSDEPFPMSRGNSFFIQYLTAEVWASGPKNPRPKCFQKTLQTRRSKPLWSLVGGGPVKGLWSFVGGYPISLPPSQPNPLCTERRCGNMRNLGRGCQNAP